MSLQQFNNEKLNLEILAEEAAEVIQIKSKIIRFGINDYHPKNKMPNREKLGQEIGHFIEMVNLLVGNGTVSKESIARGINHKTEKLKKWYCNE